MLMILHGERQILVIAGVRNIATLLLVFIALAGWWAAAAADDVAYAVVIEGSVDDDVRETMKLTSTLVTLRDQPPPTLLALRRRAEGDIPGLVQVLHSFGYYDGEVTFRVDSYGDDPAVVTLVIDQGRVYLLKKMEVYAVGTEGVELTAEERKIIESLRARALGLPLGDPALATDIVAARERLLAAIAKHGYPLAGLIKEDVVVDKAAREVTVVYRIVLGKKAFFGATSIVGLRRVSEGAVRTQVRWCEGDTYDPCKIQETENALQAMQLFEYIIIKPADAVDDDGALAITIEVAEGKHKSIGGGVSYTTQLGPGVSGEWEHRNIGGNGEKLHVETTLWKSLQRGTVSYHIPMFIRRDQELVLIAQGTNEDTTAYEESSASLSALLERHCGKRTTASVGASLKQLHSTKNDNNGDFTLLKAPMAYRWDGSNNLLNPTQGSTVHVKVTPTTQIQDIGVHWVENMVTATAYLPYDRCGNVVLAVKGVVGSIIGASRQDIPAPERFYTGNESTLRGYKYLTVSPLSPTGDPIGGKSIMVYSSELRVRHGENLGWVAFYEVGNVYSESLPRLDIKQLQSVGVGLRYYSALGPVRLDVAFPLDRRPALDSTFELYFSIGQAF